MPGDNILGDCSACCAYFPARLHVYKRSVAAYRGGFVSAAVIAGEADPQDDIRRFRRITPSGDLMWEAGTDCDGGEFATLSGSAAMEEVLPYGCLERFLLTWGYPENPGPHEDESCPTDWDSLPWGPNETLQSCISVEDVEYIAPATLRVTYADFDGENVVDYIFTEEYTLEQWEADVRALFPDPPVAPSVSLTRTGTTVTGATIDEVGSFEFLPTSAITAPGGGSGLSLTIRYRVKELRITWPGGSVYTSTPTITIGSPGGGGTTATATASLDANGRLESVTITNPGTNYASVPTVSITTPSGGSYAKPVLVAVMELASVVIANGGSNYTADPVIHFAVASETTFASNRRLGGSALSYVGFGDDYQQFGTMQVAHYRWQAPFNLRTNRVRWIERKVALEGEPLTNLEIAWPGMGLAMIRYQSGNLRLGVRFAAGSVAEVFILQGGFYGPSAGSPVPSLPTPRPDSGGTQATATGKLWLASIGLSAVGSGYTSPPEVVFSGGGGSGAAAVTTINDAGQVSSITITNPGQDYTSCPTATLVGGGGSGATATASVGFYEITITNPGTGYDYALFFGFGDGHAMASVTVDEDPDSPTFGQVTGVALTDGGNYTTEPAPLLQGPGQGQGWPTATPALPVIYGRFGEETEKFWDWDGELPEGYNVNTFQSWPASDWYTVEPPEEGYIVSIGNYREDYVAP
ncbi:hypothetical protein ASA1KI_21320 [Opitutales bacterium ASA1]|uniref:hypothetical protein n=1 Tax=Congregicoccus parvus TaxID=3081749 RepID=UPI002B2E07BB|nr:hypothetical protein ASA1KI_21320 [Opitutales bacterium ASA1]